jgi:hypothetical protein
VRQAAAQLPDEPTEPGFVDNGLTDADLIGDEAETTDEDTALP